MMGQNEVNCSSCGWSFLGEETTEQNEAIDDGRIEKQQTTDV